ncbi:Tripartite tricarboxylate transporter family receptor [compost metagenome]
MPAGTPRDIVARLHTALVEIVKRPDIRARMAELGAEPAGTSPAQFGDFIRTEIAKFDRIVKQAKITID